MRGSKKQAFCDKFHSLTGWNAIQKADGARECRTCKYWRQARYRLKRRLSKQ